MDLFVGILVLLTVTTLIGHGVWVLLRGIFRLLTGLSPSTHSEMREVLMCPRCESAGPRDSVRSGCPVCNWPLAEGMAPTPQQKQRALGLVLRRVERFHRLGLIPDRFRDRIEQAAQAEAPPPGPAAEPERPVPGPILMSETRVPVAPPQRTTVTPAPSPPADVAARAAAYQEARKQSTKRAVDPEPVASKPFEGSQQFLNLVAGFFEEKNIRWGELVGGLLIVGCSLALVISFWSSIAERPWLKFGLFNGVIALLFTLGFHAERRWKLPNTALGLLLIASLLTPLTFLAVAAMGRGSAVDFLSVVGEGIAVGLLGALTYRTGQSLVGHAPATLAVGVMIPSVAMLLVPRLVGPATEDLPLLILGSIPLLALSVSVGGLMFRSRKEPDPGESLGYEMVRLLGVCAFAAVLSLGLLISRIGPIADSLPRLSPLAPLSGAALLAPGLWLWRRLNGPEVAGLRTAGTAIAAGGTVLLLAGIAPGLARPVGHAQCRSARLRDLDPVGGAS